MEGMKSNSKIPTRKPVEGRHESLRARSNSEGKTGIAESSSNTCSLSRSVETKELKENIAPLVSKKNQDPYSAKKYLPNRSMMGYMELKRKNQELASAVRNLHGDAELQASQHLQVVAQLSREIEDHKEIQAKLRSEIKYYQGCLKARNHDVDALRRTLEQIKYENERLTSILEGASIDVVSGDRIKLSTAMADQQHQIEMDLKVKNVEMDDFIDSLELSLSQLQGTDHLEEEDFRHKSLPNANDHFITLHIT